MPVSQWHWHSEPVTGESHRSGHAVMCPKMSACVCVRCVPRTSVLVGILSMWFHPSVQACGHFKSN